MPPNYDLNEWNNTQVCDYKSTNPSVAKVAPEGKLTAVGKGKAQIVITLGPLSTTVDVQVK